MTERTHRIAIVTYPGVLRSATLGIADVFAAASAMQSGGFEVADVADLPGEPGRFDAVVLPPAAISRRPDGELPWLAAWLEAQHRSGAVICSVCAGLHWLAHTNLVRGRAVTTHWGLEAEMRAAHPELRLETHRMVIEDADLITAGGMMAWMDLSLLLVERFLGPDTADAVARMFVVERGRSNQARYRRFRPDLGHRDPGILRAQHRIEAGLAAALDGPGLAAAAGMSLRTFLRRFRQKTGLSPSHYIQEARVEKARSLLLHTDDPVSAIGLAVGYRDPSAFARVFHRLAGESPGSFRKANRRG